MTCKQFLIVGVQRTGSSVFGELLNTHPAIATGWEWTESAPMPSKLTQLQRGLAGDFSTLADKHQAHMGESISDATNWIGCRRLFGASSYWLYSPSLSLKLLYDRFHAHMSWLKSSPHIHIIHIVRDDHMGWLKSKFVAKAVGGYVGEQYPEEIKVTIPIASALRRIKAKVWIDARLGELTRSNPYLRIDYADFGAKLPTLGQQAAQFLGEDPAIVQPAETTIRRQSGKSTQHYIANYEALSAALVAAGFAIEQK